MALCLLPVAADGHVAPQAAAHCGCDRETASCSWGRCGCAGNSAPKAATAPTWRVLPRMQRRQRFMPACDRSGSRHRDRRRRRAEMAAARRDPVPRLTRCHETGVGRFPYCEDRFADRSEASITQSLRSPSSAARKPCAAAAKRAISRGSSNRSNDRVASPRMHDACSPYRAPVCRRKTDAVSRKPSCRKSNW